MSRPHVLCSQPKQLLRLWGPITIWSSSPMHRWSSLGDQKLEINSHLFSSNVTEEIVDVDTSGHRNFVSWDPLYTCFIKAYHWHLSVDERVLMLENGRGPCSHPFSRPGNTHNCCLDLVTWCNQAATSTINKNTHPQGIWQICFRATELLALLRRLV